MKRISAWFDRHPKTRIALQLVLDGVPAFLLIFPFAVGILQLKDILPDTAWWSQILNICFYIEMFGGGAALFLLGIWFHSRAKTIFAPPSWWSYLSGMLRVLSAISAIISFGALIGCIYTFLGK